ncbi:MAG: hypothetical protein HC906_12100 [Bacteroidales bacterium]|nr:hypothetical protein [Bacteroidales bacterium]
MKRILLAMVLVIFFSTCEKESPSPAQGESNQIVIQTVEPSIISYRNAVIEGCLGETYNRTVEDYGHCWDTVQNSDIA